MGSLDWATCTAIYSISAQTSQEGIKCTKARGAKVLLSNLYTLFGNLMDLLPAKMKTLWRTEIASRKMIEERLRLCSLHWRPPYIVTSLSAYLFFELKCETNVRLRDESNCWLRRRELSDSLFFPICCPQRTVQSSRRVTMGWHLFWRSLLKFMHLYFHEIFLNNCHAISKNIS